MEKMRLFSSKKEWILAALSALFLFSAHTAVYYKEYRSFISKPYLYVNARVDGVFVKNRRGKSYRLLKLKSDSGLNFYTSYFGKPVGTGDRLRLQIFPGENISFAKYMKGFYIRSRIKKIPGGSVDIRRRLADFIDRQHGSGTVSSFYKAIFLAIPMESSLRQSVSHLGISHLAALSGFHLGILWALVYGALFPFYAAVQKRFFPWRYALLDLGIVSLSVLGAYLFMTGMPHSLLRSYAMIVFAWIAVLTGIELLSFQLLLTVALLLLVAFPYLFFSISFWLSLSGVYYIYLILHYFGHIDRKLLALFVIPVTIYIMMVPVAHSVFGDVTWWQMLSPLLSLLFTLFYPLMLVLHFFGAGSLCDSCLLWLFSLPGHSAVKPISLPLLAVYIILSLTAAKSRKAMYAASAMALALQCYILI